jgi:hypothetical protein
MMRAVLRLLPRLRGDWDRRRGRRLGGGLIDRTIEVEFWRVPAAHIPKDRDDVLDFSWDAANGRQEVSSRRPGQTPAIRLRAVLVW